MSTKSRTRRVLAGVLGCLFFFLAAVLAGGREQIGRVLNSSGASLGVVPVPGSETLLNGDTLTISDKGSALVELGSGARLRVTEGTSVRFVREGRELQANLVSGAVLLESTGKPAIVLSTPKYRFQPSQEGDCRDLVRVSPEKETIAAAVKGNLVITPNDSSGSYLLLEGKYAAISASASGVPSADGPQASAPSSAKGQEATDSAGQKAASTGWHIGSLSHGASVGLVVGLSAAAAAAIAVPVATSGGAASPSAP